MLHLQNGDATFSIFTLQLSVFLFYNKQNGNECICQGKSIGFGKRKGDEVNDILIERRFYPENTINYAQSNYGIKGNAGLLLNLSDHMAGSVERYQKGVKLTNPLLLDIKRLYLLVHIERVTRAARRKK